LDFQAEKNLTWIYTDLRFPVSLHMGWLSFVGRVAYLSSAEEKSKAALELVARRRGEQDEECARRGMEAIGP
jgi:hypothetical protein